MVLHKVVVEQAEILGERWLQAGVTRRDVQRVAVVGNVEQLRDAGLRRRATVVDAQVAHLGEAIAEVEGRAHVDHIAHGVHILTLVVLHKLGVLGLNHHTEVQVVFLTDESHHHLDIVIIVLVFRETAQLVVLVRIQGVGKSVQVSVPTAISGADTVE